jgi:hypothetical protein
MQLLVYAQRGGGVAAAAGVSAFAACAAVTSGPCAAAQAASRPTVCAGEDNEHALARIIWNLWHTVI